MPTINFKILGSVFLMLGTCIGAGMLALPLTTAEFSYNTTLLYLTTSWLLMTIGAFALLEVNLWMPSGSNLFTMAKNTLGNAGNIFSLIIYLLLLYSLIAAYIAGASDILQGVLVKYNFILTHKDSTLLAFFILFIIISLGIRVVDLTNRMLMLLKIVTFSVMIYYMLGQTNYSYVSNGSSNITSINAFTLMITAFGFAIILPTLRDYLEDEHSSLIYTLSIGCFIPLFIYCLWVFAVYGILPKTGQDGLAQIALASNPNTELVGAISKHTGYKSLVQVSNMFVSICAITSFLGVATCLVDFIKDIINYLYNKYYYETNVDDRLSLHQANKVHNYIKSVTIYLLAFAIPLLLVFYNPGIFIQTLSYAGILVLIFLVINPLVMLYTGRYKLEYVGRRFIPGDKKTIVFLLVLSTLLLTISILNIFQSL